MVLNLRDGAQNIGFVNVVMSTIAMSLSSYMHSTYIVLYICAIMAAIFHDVRRSSQEKGILGLYLPLIGRIYVKI